MSKDRSMTRPTGAGIFSAADIKRRQPSARRQKLLKNCAMRRSRRKARGRDGGVSQTARQDGRANDATSGAPGQPAASAARYASIAASSRSGT